MGGLKTKAYSITDRNCDSGHSIVVFAKTRGKALAYAAWTDDFCDYGFIGLKAHRVKELDRFYRGKPEMNWHDQEDRISMVRYAGFQCSYEIDNESLKCEDCPAKEWCGRYESIHDEG